MGLGKFIVFEGIDGSGKSTQIDILRDRIVKLGQETISTAEPTTRSVGQLIRKVLSKTLVVSEETLAAMFVADRLDHIQNEEEGMLVHLKSNVNVLSDRYYWSSYAYHGLDLPIRQVMQMNEICHNLLKPDLTIYMDLTAEESIERITKRAGKAEKFEQLELLQKIRNNYFEAFQMADPSEQIVFIDASKDQDQCAEDIWKIVEPVIS